MRGQRWNPPGVTYLYLRDAGLDGVASRSAAPGGGRELAWFQRSDPTVATERLAFNAWW